MKRIELTQRLDVPTAQWKFRRAAETDYSTLVTDSTDVLLAGQLALRFQLCEQFPADLIQACQAIKQYDRGARAQGLRVQCRTLGYLPRVTMFRDFCCSTSLAIEQPAVHDTLVRYAQQACRIYQAADPDRYARAVQALQDVRSCWRLPDTVFTSGIVNRDSALAYHHDTGNFKDVWSCMYAVAHDVDGGVLSVPELGLGFSFDRPALIMFDGQGLLHGVTPVRPRNPQAYRYSVVYYGMQQMRHCLDPAEELARIRKVRVTRENRRAANLCPQCSAVMPDHTPTCRSERRRKER